MITTKYMWAYRNGNYNVFIRNDGTKKRTNAFGVDVNNNDLFPVYPESIDLKVTNKCNAGCAFCHEDSVLDGANFDPAYVNELLIDLPSGVEVAIGGGNPFEVSRDLRWLMDERKNIIFNMTVNAMHLKHYWDSWLFPYGLGVSYNKTFHDEIKEFVRVNGTYDPQVVIHLIAGVHSISDLERCVNDFDRILILGYKTFGRGVKYKSEKLNERLNEWSMEICKYMKKGKIIAFDNLALEQLDVKRYFTKERWDNIYMGGEGKFSFYIDAVLKQYAPSSYMKRKEIYGKSIQEMFENVRNWTVDKVFDTV